jgi:hypothetical protein
MLAQFCPLHSFHIVNHHMHAERFLLDGKQWRIGGVGERESIDNVNHYSLAS